MDSALPFTIRSASWRDVHELSKLERACFEQDAWPLIDLLGVLSFPGVVRLKAEMNGKMIGFIGGETRDHQQTGWIITLGVLPEYRRQGVAQELLQECEAQLASVRTIRLCVRVSNEGAIHLYKNMGYVQVEIWAQYYRGGEDALVLEKQII
ncbi:MAG: GNAT family N-acetyltransferase [Chloroflexi bacterium]|nr:GNAT family N-acetyltransferase [Chloroflexota bacterium]